MKNKLIPTKRAETKSTTAPNKRRAWLIEQIKKMWPIEIMKKQDGSFVLSGDLNSSELMEKWEQTMGTFLPALGIGLINQAMGTSTSGKATEEDHNRTLAAIHGIRPQNALEGMLAVQMVGMHNLAMEFKKRKKRGQVATIDILFATVCKWYPLENGYTQISPIKNKNAPRSLYGP